jgi:putative long chain acyl-CoA synthase
VLLVRVEPTPLSPLDEAADEPRSLAPSPRLLRGVRGRDDPWYVTGDLMRCDEDGDYWLIDSLAGCIRTEEGLVPSRPIEDALYELDEVAGAVVYGVPAGDGATELVVAALVLRPGTLLDSRKLVKHLQGSAPVGALPAFVRLIDQIPMTGGFRPQKATLRVEGITADGKCLRYEPTRGEYVVLGTTLTTR